MRRNGAVFAALAMLAAGCTPVEMTLLVRPGGEDLVVFALGGLLDPERDEPPRIGYSPASGTKDAFVEIRPDKDGLSILGQDLTNGTVYLLDCRGLNAGTAEVRLYEPLGANDWQQIASQSVADSDRVAASYSPLTVIVQVDGTNPTQALWLFVHAGDASSGGGHNGVRVHIDSSTPFITR